MSHVTRIHLEIHDLDALAEACRELGLELVRDQRSFRKYGRRGKCEHAIVLPGNKKAYEIGVVRRKKARGYELALDDWKKGYGILDKVGGKQCPKLRQGYAAAATIRKMEAEGFQWTKKTSPKGWVRLRFCHPTRRASA